jgi:hypothetical protein
MHSEITNDTQFTTLRLYTIHTLYTIHYALYPIPYTLYGHDGLCVAYGVQSHAQVREVLRHRHGRLEDVLQGHVEVGVDSDQQLGGLAQIDVCKVGVLE